ncbi:MAG TPA: hypothetical protein VIV15_11200, partial [Anaerolineales bacterium]
MLLSLGPGARAAKLAQLLGDFKTGVNIEEQEILVHLPSGLIRISVQKVVLEDRELQGVFLV